MHFLSALVVLGASLANAAIGPDCANGPLKDNKICDVTAAPAERAAALVEAMQTNEKLDNLMRCASTCDMTLRELTKPANQEVLPD
jgi:beta-D-xylosidase 4